MLFRARDICVSYEGDTYVLRNVSLEVDRGEVVCILGANGSGKTTLVKAVSGLVLVSRGRLEFDGKYIEKLPANRRVRCGISLCPEGRKLFSQLTVFENLKLGSFARRDKGEIRGSLEWVYELFPILGERKDQAAGTLSGGEQQMLAVGRALMSRPKILMLDEPTLGLAPLVIDEIYASIREIVANGMTLLLVEQNASKALEISDRGYVLETGRIIMEGSGSDLRANPAVREAYLG